MSLLQTLVYLISAVLSIALGVLALRQDLKEKSNVAFFQFTLFNLLWAVSLFLAYYFSYLSPPALEKSILFFRLAYGFGIAMFMLMVRFLYFFPRVTFSLPRPVLYLFYGSAIFIFFASSFTPLVHQSQYLVDGVYDDTDVFGSLYSVYLFLTLAYFFIASAVALIKVRMLHGIERKKMAIATTGALFLVTSGVINVVLPIFDFWKVGLGPLTVQALVHYSPSLTLLFILPTFYSIYRYRFFNFSHRAFNFIRYLILVSFYLVSVYLIDQLVSIYVHGDILPLLFSGLGALAFFQFADRAIPHLVTSDFRDFKNALSELTSKIYYSESYQTLSDLLEQYFVVRLNIKNARLFVIRKKGERLKVPVYHEDAFIRYLNGYPKAILVSQEIPFQALSQPQKDAFGLAFHQLDAAICFPLRSDGNLVGFFVLGNKPGKADYSQEEIHELIHFRRYLEIAFVNNLFQMNLQRENDLMKRIIEKKTKQLRVQYEQIQFLVGQQADFIAVTAHEFRTPLTVALFQLDDLLNDLQTLSKKDLRQQLRHVDDSLKSLKELTQKLFDIQRYDLNKIEVRKEEVPMKDFIDLLYREFKLQADQKKIDFRLSNRLPKRSTLPIDKSQMRQVLTNLLANAYKFTPEAGKILFEASRDKKGRFLLKIGDSGPGVPPELRKAVFEKFKTHHKGSGLGLGLYICQKIVKLHQGKIWVEDSPLGGALFQVLLNP